MVVSVLHICSNASNKLSDDMKLFCLSQFTLKVLVLKSKCFRLCSDLFPRGSSKISVSFRSKFTF